MAISQKAANLFLVLCLGALHLQQAAETGNRNVRRDRKYMIIDTDGSDHSILAMLLPLQDPNTEVLAITTVGGASDVNQATGTVRRLLQTMGKTQIPVYQGVQRPLVQQSVPSWLQRSRTNTGGNSGSNNNDRMHQNTSAPLAIVNLVERYRREKPSILALGPLTNIALALRMSESVANVVEDVAIVESTIPMLECNNIVGDNSMIDPEAMNVTLSTFRTPVKMVTRAACQNNSISWRAYERIVNVNNNLAQMVKRSTSQHAREMRQDRRRPGYESCPALAAAMLTRPDIVRGRREMTAVVELNGLSTRGAMMMQGSMCRSQSMRRNIVIPNEVDMMAYERILERSVAGNAQRTDMPGQRS